QLINKTIGDPPFPVGAAANSALPITFSIMSGPATIAGNLITLTGAGQVTVRASQAGNDNYNPGVDVDQSFTVAKAGQTITFGQLGNKTFGDPPFTLTALANSPIPITFNIVSGPATISGNTITLTGVGRV